MRITAKFAGLAVGLLVILFLVQSYFTVYLYNRVSALETGSSSLRSSPTLDSDSSLSRSIESPYGLRQFSTFNKFFKNFDRNFGRQFDPGVNQWDPLAEMKSFHDEFFSSLDNPFTADFNATPFAGSFGNSDIFTPEIEFTQEPDRYIVRVFIPEASNINLKSSVRDNQLLIEGEAQIEKNSSPDDGNVLSSQSYSSSFSRTFSIPNDVDKNRITQKHEDGELKIILPRL